ncbi:hypothetical protein [Virgibacillus halodenitrificans]|uniref:hypothetical protein n=1 Tax=Virgibacillus halodenitrificans TaxID=1482 RepID=UPI002DB7510B|nr:hypothetical protein [Virgibacillus halodenitrificans]MEC2158485.1 hypothetical protein [Virgibacillus halodenitrificans]
MRNLIIGIVILLILFIVLPLFGINNFFIFDLIEWATKFVFPWVVLYWLIRTVKYLEKKG